ncbi:WD40/YVTN/BNR-like repeat-containing protein [Nocardioides sp. T2.26MG-1]|uniref:WD40/YVTN/BNR-like repeat-containing protein n=1 Tax=Nocardioides sp. T2.26MG-1 TaxID=3041166 RepID=UPI002477544B|nr:oxidoreductase [Nocardioides sp. T2.26MG-1]CAI9409809.1 Ycf48-like protein [Nocardioides sp. T2.26MG-1]
MRRLLGMLTVAALAVTALTTPIGAADPASAAPPRSLHWRHVDVGTDQQLRGLDAVSASTAWVGGSAGGVWRTTNGGRTWVDVSPRGADGLLFRDVEARSARVALAMTIGEGRDSRIYRTTNGGRTWAKVFVNRSKKAFYDCMAMYPGGKHGLAMSDPVDGKFRIIATHDGGASWRVVDPAGMPKAVDGEFGFAASGTCLVTAGHRDAYLASGGAASRIFASHDRGRHWQVRRSTIPASDAGGVFSLSFRGGEGIAVGGDFQDEDNGADASAYSHSRGRAWHNGGDLGGYRSGVDWRAASVAIAVGPSGSDVTRDGGRTWRSFSGLALDAVQCVSGACWASGPEGTVVRLVKR